MSEKSTYKIEDLEVGKNAKMIKEGGAVIHSHQVVFGRPLTQAERQLFRAIMDGFYYTVHYSRQFGDGLLGLPIIDFETPDRARYVIKQTKMSGPWKDLLFAILANFSYEVVPIRQHDDSRVFDPERSQKTAHQSKKS